MRKLFLLIAICTSFLWCGCQSEESSPAAPASPSDFYTENSMSILEYQMYLANKIAVATGQLNTHMSKLKNVIDGSCTPENEIEAIDFSVKTLKDDKRDMNYMHPPETYLTTQEHALEYWQQAIDKLQEAKEVLSGNTISKDKLMTIISELKDIYTSIQSLNSTV